MARRAALPGGALNALMKEARPRPALSRQSRAARRAPSRPPKEKRGGVSSIVRTPRDGGDPVARYAASRGVEPHGGPLEVARLAFQMAVDVREVAKKERIAMVTVVARALAGYLSDKD